MRKFFLMTIFLMVCLSIRAQNVLEVLAGNQQAHYINYFDKDLDSTGECFLNCVKPKLERVISFGFFNQNL